MNSSTLRYSCDACYNSKVKCSRDKPECSRCKSNGLACDYSPGKKPGRRRKQPLTIESIQADAVAESQASSPTQNAWLTSSFFDMETSLGLDKAVCPDGDDVDMATFVDTSGYTPDPSWMHGFDVLSPVGAGHLDLSQAVALPPDDANAPLSAEAPWQSITSKALAWLPDKQQFWQDCGSLNQWSSSSPSLTALRGLSRNSDSRPQCSCLAGITSLQFHTRQHSNLQVVPLDGTFHLQRMLIWTQDAQQECKVCAECDTGKFILAGVASHLASAYRSILEAQGSSPSTASDEIYSVALMVDQTALQGSDKVRLLYRMVEHKLLQLHACLERLAAPVSRRKGVLRAAQPLQLLIQGVCEQLNVIKGLLETLRYGREHH